MADFVSHPRGVAPPRRSHRVQTRINTDAAEHPKIRKESSNWKFGIRSFWDKAVIAHGLRRWYEIRGELRQEGQRISRHYYDLHCLHNSSVGPIALADRNLAADCVRHARLFFNRPDFDLASAQPGSWAVEPSPGMLDRLRVDYEKMSAMIFGAAPAFEETMASIKALNVAANRI